MLDIKRIREQPDLVRKTIETKHGDPVLDEVIEKDLTRRAIIGRAEVLKNKRNTVSEEVARRKRAKEISKIVS